MPKTQSLLELHRTDTRIQLRLERIEVVSVSAAVVVAGSSLAQSLTPSIGSALQWTEMPLAGAVAALCCAVGLALSS
jgi:hypothetical protein